MIVPYIQGPTCGPSTHPASLWKQRRSHTFLEQFASQRSLLNRIGIVSKNLAHFVLWIIFWEINFKNIKWVINTFCDLTGRHRCWGLQEGTVALCPRAAIWTNKSFFKGIKSCQTSWSARTSQSGTKWSLSHLFLLSRFSCSRVYFGSCSR